MQINLNHMREQFLEPDGSYTPLPFWFWNGNLEQEELLRQLHDFRDKGVEGFVLHPRIGIPDTLPYLSEAFMDLVEIVTDEAAKLNMQVILYDEGMYPSGSANGEIVRRRPDYASRGLVMLEQLVKDTRAWTIPLEEGDRIVSVQAVRKTGPNVDQMDHSSTRLITAADRTVSFNPPDDEEWLYIAFIDRFSNGTIRGIHYGQDDGEPDAPRAADLLNPEAVQLFIELTHERYYARIGRHFGQSVIAMFTDEPDLLGRRHRKGMQPWTADFLEEFIRFGNREEDLAALWLDTDGNAAEIRSRYRKAVRDRMERAFYKPLHDWCEEHGIALTGHPAASDDIGLLRYFHIPGQDVVWRWLAPEDDKGVTGKHSTMGKCSADSARHRNKLKNLNECFGVCGKGNSWALTADDMKWYLDWLFVRGVNMICPHAFYYSIEGKRLHERAPDVGPHNIWWPEYGRFSQYMKRMSWVMTGSINQTQVAVLCHADHLSWELTRPLYEHQIEFNYLEEELLQQDCVMEEGLISIANQQYGIVLLEDANHFETETLERLEEFIRQGGVVLEHKQGSSSLDRSVQPGWDILDSATEMADSLRRLLPYRAEFKPASSDLRMSHVKKDGIHLYVLVNEGDSSIEGSLFMHEQGTIEVWDAWNGAVRPAQTGLRAGGMDISLQIERRQSLIIAMDPAGAVTSGAIRTREEASVEDFSDGWSVDGLEGFIPLTSWTEWEGKAHFSGTLIYTREIQWDRTDSYEDIVLHLGEVHEMARVFLNGELVDVRLWSPYCFSLKEHLQQGTNLLQVEVTNTLANRYDNESFTSGLLGPVSIVCSVKVTDK